MLEALPRRKCLRLCREVKVWFDFEGRQVGPVKVERNMLAPASDVATPVSSRVTSDPKSI